MSTHEPCRYEIRVHGHLDARWRAWLEGMAIDVEPGGVTVLRGPVTDQAALHGVLARLRDIGLPLISVTPAVDCEPEDDR